MKLLKKGNRLLSEDGKLLVVDLPDLKNGEAVSSVVMEVLEGEGTYPNRATGARSMAIGNGTIAKEKNQLVIGAFNEDEENALFIVGNGNNTDDRSNAFEVLKDGRVKSNGTPTEDNDLTPKKYVDDLFKTLNLYDYTYTTNPYVEGAVLYLENVSVEENTLKIKNGSVANNTLYL
jgi:hypothetical protein